MDADLEFDEAFDDDEIEPDDEPPRRRSPLRLILLILVVLVLLCLVCYGGSNLLGPTIANLLPVGSLPPQAQSLLGVSEETPPPPPAFETPAPEPVSTEELPLPETSEPGLTEEPPPPATDELPATSEATEEPAGPTEEPPVEAQPTQEPTQEPGEEATPTATTEPVPGPTSTPTPTPPSDTTPEAGPTVAVTATSCEDNTPPTANANGPYTAMMGKGEAFITFDATGSSDPDGDIVKYEWDFGDGSELGSGETVTHAYTAVDSYVAILTVTDDCNATGQDIAEVTIVGPTPPANGDDNGTPTPTPTATSTVEATMGFCYLVQRGNTLAGIAWYYQISLPDLAAVNGVSTNYLVIAGQGLFIPSGEITDSPNTYLVQAGDTLNIIAYQCGLTTTALAEANGLDTEAELTPGQTVIIPRWIDQ